MNGDTPNQQQITFPLDPASVQILLQALTPYFGAALVSQIVAGVGISISPVTGLGSVTITNAGVQSLLVGAGLTLSGSTGNITITVSDATLATSDITTNNVSTSKHGFAPKAPNDATKYLDGTGAYSVPSGGGGSVVSATGTDSLTAFTPIATTHTITHGLGVTPAIVTAVMGDLLTPLPPGAGVTYSSQACWMYLDNTGTAVGGEVVSTTIVPGGGGSRTLTGIAFGPTSISASGSDTGGTGNASITLNNFTPTTFDIVYAATQSTGSTSFTFPTVTWRAIG